MEQEVSVLRACANCPQIVQVLGVDVTSAANQPARLSVIMELCEQGSVSDVLWRLQAGFTEVEIQIITREVLKGLQYLHDGKKIHRDVKAGNILLTKEFRPKLADFGISCQLSNTWARRNTQIGSPYWMAPEVIKGEAYNATADIWSLGITCIEMADCKPPYYHIPPTRAMFVISNKPPTGLADPSKASADFVDFVSASLTVKAAQRPTAQVLLKHPFIESESGRKMSPLQALEESLGPRLESATHTGKVQTTPLASTGGSQQGSDRKAGYSGSWKRRSMSGNSLSKPKDRNQSSQSMALLANTQSLVAATPSIDAFAMASPSSPSSQCRRWQAGDSSVSPRGNSLLPASTDEEEPQTSEELRRRAREWVNRMVPMQNLEDEPESPVSNKSASLRSAHHFESDRFESTELLILPSSAKAKKGKLAGAGGSKGNFEVWDSDEEGVETRMRMRVEAQPEAGAGGPREATPYFMQVLGKQLA
eukprot:TRINITY_DN10633_c0_g1_i4.p1 TRINITY_DN10633_c0_g1~~TRINITY_DN10633_c0_g1_i4.p1  ORF type:complete len:556 (+),score=110.98 TRINITY_DN10633_c0_g1_i4:233-1669(+)